MHVCYCSWDTLYVHVCYCEVIFTIVCIRMTRGRLASVLDKDLQEVDKRLRSHRDLEWLKSSDRSQRPSLSRNIE